MMKPKVKDVTGWVTIWKSEEVFVDEAVNHPDYYRVDIWNKPRKYFYGEFAWSDVQRHIVDSTGDMNAWRIFN